jgi:hypothetical protein
MDVTHMSVLILNSSATSINRKSQRQVEIIKITLSAQEMKTKLKTLAQLDTSSKSEMVEVGEELEAEEAVKESSNVKTALIFAPRKINAYHLNVPTLN